MICGVLYLSRKSKVKSRKSKENPNPLTAPFCRFRGRKAIAKGRKRKEELTQRAQRSHRGPQRFEEIESRKLKEKFQILGFHTASENFGVSDCFKAYCEGHM
jgi:hypothetical protein